MTALFLSFDAARIIFRAGYEAGHAGKLDTDNPQSSANERRIWEAGRKQALTEIETGVNDAIRGVDRV